jgi:arylformamidase
VVTRLLDISPPLSERSAVWPGDVAFRREVSLSIASGDDLDLSAIHTTVHLGAHADAPSHYRAEGPGIGECSLEPYYGPCQVIETSLRRGVRLRPADIQARVEAPRLLFRTGSFPDPERFNEDFNSLSPELVDWAAAQGVVLLGIDTPSVDPFDDRVLESHQALARHGLVNLEGLALEGVEPGCYTLVALPLRLEGADASPVRAVLVAP